MTLHAKIPQPVLDVRPGHGAQGDPATPRSGHETASPNADLGRAISVIVDALRSGGTVYCCGNGGSHAHAAHLVAELRVGMAYRHQALEAKLLCGDLAEVLACANDLGFDQVFAHPAGALRRSDVLVVLSTSGQSQNVRNAVRVANERGARTVALVGARGLGVCDESQVVDVVEVRSAATTTPAIQEQHQAWVHEIAKRVEEALCPR